MSTSSTLAIRATGLTRAFGDVRAVDRLDLSVPAGGVYAVLGPNGAGKTTTIRMLATLLPPDSGRAVVLGHDVVTEAHEVRSRISLTGQFASVDRDLTGWENLVLAGRLVGLDRARARTRADELLDAFDLQVAARRQVRHYSGGMLRRLDIAASIAVVPDLLFLDEPTTGLDPRSRGQVWDIVRALVTNGSTVVLTTQYLDEADKLADRIAVIDHGRVVAEGTSDDLKTSVGAGTLQVRLADAAQLETARRVLDDVLPGQVERATDPVSLTVPVPRAAVQAVVALSQLTDAGIAIREFGLGRPSLDEVFLAITGRGGRDDEPTTAEPSGAAAEKELTA